MKTMKNHNLMEELLTSFSCKLSWALHRIRAFLLLCFGPRCVLDRRSPLCRRASHHPWCRHQNLAQKAYKTSFGRILVGFPLFLYGKLVMGFLPSRWPHLLEAPSLASRRSPRRGDRPTPKLRRQNSALQGPCNVWATLVIIGTVNSQNIKKTHTLNRDNVSECFLTFWMNMENSKEQLCSFQASAVSDFGLGCCLCRCPGHYWCHGCRSGGQQIPATGKSYWKGCEFWKLWKTTVACTKKEICIEVEERLCHPRNYSPCYSPIPSKLLCPF